MLLSYIIGIGCSAVLAGVAALVFLKDNTEKKDNDNFLDWPDDNCCHYEGDF
jgi:hypothetical protein